jgi:arginyl-tRNA synthetase
MNVFEQLTADLKVIFKEDFQVDIDPQKINFQKTRKEFEGDFTLVVFPFVKEAKMAPPVLGQKLGEALVERSAKVKAFQVVKGFLNLSLDESYWRSFYIKDVENENYGFSSRDDASKGVMVEYSSPNTNKPLHLGHIRNCLLGNSVSRLIEASGRKVYKVQIINDRGIHICKSMLAWQRYGNGETPQSAGMKGDKLVGKYYVLFDQEYKKEIEALIANGMESDQAAKEAPILKEAQEMLRSWEAGDSEVLELWSKMNQWVYDGFDATYAALGVDFDKNYFESSTYLTGKEEILRGLDEGVFYQKEDGSVWADLSDHGMDEKILLRSDGTAVYMTQDIGTAIKRFRDFDIDRQIYTVGNEQDYHFKVLFILLEMLGYKWAVNNYHLSYGMVDLPSGKMKSREGTVVDADDLIVEMEQTARSIGEELGKLEGFDEEYKDALYHTIGLGALKYFILKVDPKKRMMFDPTESVDFNGNTGPFIQYTYARIQSILRRGAEELKADIHFPVELEESERDLLRYLHDFPTLIQQAAQEYSPALVANYVYDLVKAYNHFYQSISIFQAEDPDRKEFRVRLSNFVGHAIRNGMWVLGIDVPERM